MTPKERTGACRGAASQPFACTILKAACLCSTPLDTLHTEAGNLSAMHLVADYMVLPPAWALHHADALRTHIQAVVRSGALGVRPGQRIVSQQLNNNLHYVILYDFETLNKYCVCVSL
jgi:hypothetical protein